MSPDKQTLDELRIDRRPAPKSWRSPWLAIVSLAAIAAGAGLVWWLNRPKATVVRTILVQESASGGQKTLLNASGYVTARRQATVSSKVTGKVIEVLVEEGIKIEDGQILGRNDFDDVVRRRFSAHRHLHPRGHDFARDRSGRERELHQPRRTGAEGRGHAGLLPGLAHSLQSHRHHSRRGPAKGHCEGASGIRETGTAHPAGYGRESRVSGRRRKTAHAWEHPDSENGRPSAG